MIATAMHKSRGHQTERRLPIGAEVMPDGRISFRVWAPKHKRVHVAIATDFKSPPADELRLQAEGDGHFSLLTDRAKTGTCYGFKLNNGQRILPDPASRFQPDGPAGLFANCRFA